MGRGPFGLGEYGFDGVAVFLQQMGFLLSLLGGLLKWGKRKLSSGSSPMSVIDKVIGALLNFAGWGLVSAGLLLAMIGGTQLFYSVEGRGGYDEFVSCIREPDSLGSF